jgi:hypothetical protein
MNKDGLDRLKRAVTALLTVLVLLLFADPSLAQQVGGCDPLYMQALKGRGYIEGGRESARNKSLIYKEDSVLEYSCIFSYVTNLDQETPIPFAAGALDHIVTTPAFNFLSNSFGHYYLGDRFYIGNTVDQDTPYLPSGDYFCDALARVWEIARCIDVNQYTTADNFFDFSWYEANDPRIYPTDYQKCTYAVKGVDLQSAFRNVQSQWLMDPNLAINTNTYGVDPMQTYAALTSWDPAIPGSNACGTPIPTGLTIYRKNSSYADYICPKPGCTHIPAGTGPGTCSNQ